MEGLKEKTAHGLFWGGLSNGLQQLLGLVFGIILSRILSVEDYGIMGMLAIFTGVANSIQEGGFITALTNRQKITHDDYNSVFWFNVFIGIGLYTILFFCAPLIARFYGKPELIWVSRVVFLSILFGCLGTAQAAYLFKKLMVKERAKIDIISFTIASILSLVLALSGFGYWGLAIQLTVHIGLMTLLRWFYSDWRPNLNIRFEPVKKMLPFSIKILLTGLFAQISGNIFSLLIGKHYTETQVGYYSQGNKWMNMAKSFTTGMVAGVAQPVFAEVADQEERKTQIFRKLLRFTAFISFPCMFGLALISPEFILLTITEKWLPTVPILQLLCIWGAFYPICEIYKNIVLSTGKPDIYLWTNVIFGIIQIALLLLVIPFGIYWMTAAYVAIYFIYLFIWHYWVTQIIPLRLIHVLKDILPYLGISCMVLGVGFYFSTFFTNAYLKLIIKIAIPIPLYILIMWKSGSVIFQESVEFIKNYFYHSGIKG